MVRNSEQNAISVFITIANQSAVQTKGFHVFNPNLFLAYSAMITDFLGYAIYASHLKSAQAF